MHKDLITRTHDYLKLLEQSLEQIRNDKPVEDLEFSKQDLSVLRDHFSNLTVQVTEKFEDEVLIHLFQEKLKRFTNAYVAEWQILFSILKDQIYEIRKEQRDNFKGLMQHFHETSQGVSV